MFVVGLTGGIGSGKSAVADCFLALGITVVNADTASRKVVEKGMPALNAIAGHFGEDILQADGTLNRAALRRRIFTDPSEKAWLESLLHPLIGQWIQEQLASAEGPYVILESPLLLETGQHKLADRVLVVDVPESVQLERAMARDDTTEEQIRAIMAAQLSREDRLAGADDIIDNSGPKEKLHDKVKVLHDAYLKMAQMSL